MPHASTLTTDTIVDAIAAALRAQCPPQPASNDRYRYRQEPYWSVADVHGNGASNTDPAPVVRDYLHDHAYPVGSVRTVRRHDRYLVADGMRRTVTAPIADRVCHWKYAVATLDSSGDTHDWANVWSGSQDDAEAIAAQDAQYPQGCTRQAMRLPINEHGRAMQGAQWEAAGEKRTITRRLIQPVTIAGRLRRALQQWEDTEACPVAIAMLNGNTHNTHCDYIALRNGVMSFLPYGKPHVTTDEGTWSRVGRQEAKPGRLARRILTDAALSHISDHDLECFGNRAVATRHEDTDAIRLVCGDDIARYYHEESYASAATGTLANSCMRYDYCASYFGIYTENPDTVQMAILENDDGLIGRALVWTLTDGRTALDRAYGSDPVQSALYNYARSEGWLLPYSEGRYHTLTVRVPNCQHDQYPYMDTFMYLDTSAGTLSTSQDDADYSLQDTHGSADSIGSDCAACDERIPHDDERYSDGGSGPYCEDCYHERYSACYHCDGEVYNDHAEQTPDGNAVCDYCYREHYRLCDECSEVVDTEDSRYSDQDGCTYCADCDPWSACPTCGYDRDPEITAIPCPGCVNNAQREQNRRRRYARMRAEHDAANTMPQMGWNITTNGILSPTFTASTATTYRTPHDQTDNERF